MVQEPAVPATRGALRVGVVGGSNTLLKEGYAQALGRNLEQVHGLKAVLEVIAMGATSSLFGLANLCRTGIHRRVDVLVFEYALNDAASFGTAPGLYEHWAKAYEAVIRKARAEQPGLLFISLVLGQKNGPHASRICPVSAGVQYLGNRYGVHTVDINQILALEHPAIYNSDKLYTDTSHYSRPLGVDLIGEILGRYIFSLLEDKGPAQLPEPLYEGNYAHARYLALPKAARIGAENVGICRNALFEERYVALTADRSLSFEITGKILLLLFVSHAASPIIRITVGEAVHRQPTCRATFRKRSLKFLLSGLSPEFHGNYSIAGHKKQCVLNFFGGGAVGEAVETDANQAVGIFDAPVVESADTSIWLVGLLYCGSISRLALV